MKLRHAVLLLAVSAPIAGAQSVADRYRGQASRIIARATRDSAA
jgi:hypothetical protein